MIVVDSSSSALIAILLGEPEKQAFEDIIAGGKPCVMSAVNAHKTATVLRLRHGTAAVERFWPLLADSEIDIVPFDEQQVRAAAIAFDLYGKGMFTTRPSRPFPTGTCNSLPVARTSSPSLIWV